MKKTILLTTLVVLLLVGVTGLSVHYYQERKPQPAISVSQALQERNDAQRLTALHDAVNQANVATLNKQVSDTQAKLTSVCASLKTTKVLNANCQ